MSFDVSWDICSYKEEHESDEHWALRKAFMERWKNDYPEERLVCLAQVFANIEFLGCRYPLEVMQEVAKLSHDVVQQYRKRKKTKLQRTFVSASDAAEDRARGVKREGGVVKDGPISKSAKIMFVRQGESETVNTNNTSALDETAHQTIDVNNEKSSFKIEKKVHSDPDEYLSEMLKIKCLDVRSFSENMFNTQYGKMVLFIRSWASKLSNIQSSCQACRIPLRNTYQDQCYSLFINEIVVAQAVGLKIQARSAVESIAWNKLCEEVPSIFIKEQLIEDGERVSLGDVSTQKEFGTPVDNAVAIKMMKLMGWKGGGLGADAQGIEEPIKPHMQMVNRAGLGSDRDIRHLRRAGQELMKRFIASDTIDVDLVFSSEFSKEERAALHQTAQRAGLASKSYGDVDRFLVVKKKLKPFSLFRAIVEKGGNTPKYRVFLPAAVARYR